jgi:hypothetical protein
VRAVGVDAHRQAKIRDWGTARGEALRGRFVAQLLRRRARLNAAEQHLLSLQGPSGQPKRSRTKPVRSRPASPLATTLRPSVASLFSRMLRVLRSAWINCEQLKALEEGAKAIGGGDECKSNGAGRKASARR